MKLKRVHAILIISGIAMIIFFTSASSWPSGHGEGAEHDVRVINGFRDNSSLPLVIWCTTGRDGDDMGGRALQEGDDFGWTVRPSSTGSSFLGTTSPNDYVCTMKWDERRRKFRPYVPSRSGPLRKCSWLVTEDGFFFSNDEVNWKKEFSWFSS